MSTYSATAKRREWTWKTKGGFSAWERMLCCTGYGVIYDIESDVNLHIKAKLEGIALGKREACLKNQRSQVHDGGEWSGSWQSSYFWEQISWENSISQMPWEWIEQCSKMVTGTSRPNCINRAQEYRNHKILTTIQLFKIPTPFWDVVHLSLLQTR